MDRPEFEVPSSGWPKFSRATLWMIIIVLIPLITVLNNLGQDPVEPQGEPYRDRFPLDELEFIADGPDWQVSLPGSGIIAIGVAVPGVLTSRVELPQHQDFDVAIRRDHTLTYVQIPAERAGLDVTLEFLQQWLPPLDERSHVIVAGEITEATLSYVREALEDSTGSVQPFEQPKPEALTAIPLPDMGTLAQRQVLLAANILQARLSGYGTSIQWNHRGSTSYLTVNATLKQEWLTPVSEEEFVQAKNAMERAAKQTDRNVGQILRYLMTVALENLSADFIQNQSSRIAALNLNDAGQGMAYLRNQR